MTAQKGTLMYLGEMVVLSSSLATSEVTPPDEWTSAARFLEKLPHNFVVIEPLKFDQQLYRHLELDPDSASTRRLYRILFLGVTGSSDRLESVTHALIDDAQKIPCNPQITQALENPYSNALVMCRVPQAEEALRAGQPKLAEQLDFLEQLYRTTVTSSRSGGPREVDALWLEKRGPGIYRYHSFLRDFSDHL